MIYPYSITFQRIPIDASGNHRFKVKALRETAISVFDVVIHSDRVLVDGSGSYVDKSPPSCAIGIQIRDASGRTICEETMQLASIKWQEQSVDDKGHALWRSLTVQYPELATGAFTILVQVMTPSRNKGDYLTIRGKGLLELDTKTKQAKPPLPTGMSPEDSTSITIP